jgi:uncharacterized membrane protein
MVPAFIVVYLLYWAIYGTEMMMKKLLVEVLPFGWYSPGLGIVVVLVGLYLIGLLMYPWITRRAIESIEKIFRRLPIVGTIYSSVHDMVDLFDDGMKEKLGRPVLVDLSSSGMKTVGFLMRESTTGLPLETGDEDAVVVYLQMSYQIGGYALIVPKDRVQRLDMSVETAMQWVFTAGVSVSSIEKAAGRGGA